MLGVTQPCGTLCVPPLTPIHLAEMVCTALILNCNSQTSLLEKSLLVSWAKLTLKPKHVPECLYSLKQHLHNFFYPSLALFTHTLSLHDREQAVLNLVAGNVFMHWGTVRCLYPALDQISTAKLYVLDLLYFKGCIKPWDLYFWSKYIYFSGFFKIRCWYWVCSKMRYWKPIPLLQFLRGITVLRTGSQHATGQQLWRVANLHPAYFYHLSFSAQKSHLP